MGEHTVEHKNRCGGEALGASHAAMRNMLASPLSGVHIRNQSFDSRKIIRKVEIESGINNWIDNK